MKGLRGIRSGAQMVQLGSKLTFVGHLRKMEEKMEELFGANESEDMSSLEDPCYFESSTELKAKFVTLVMVTPVICVVGIVSNILTIFVYVVLLKRCSKSYYLASIAFADLLTLLTSLVIYPVEILWEYYQSVWLSRLWHHNINWVYTISHTGPLMSVYLTIAATVERYVAMTRPICYQWMYGGRKIFVIIIAIMLCSFTFNLGKLWEFELQVDDNCTNLARYTLVLTWESLNSTAFGFYTVWLSSIVAGILPFFVLLVMNLLIASGNYPVEASEPNFFFIRIFHMRYAHPHRRATNQLIIMVALTFLVVSFPGLVLTIIEYVNMSFLLAHPSFYGFYKDVINVLTIVNASVNFIIQFKYDLRFRRSLRYVCCRRKNSAITKLSSQMKNIDQSIDSGLCNSTSA